MTDLERRLRRALEGLPGPSEEARARAERAAMDALPPPARRRPRWLLAAAAAGAAVAVAGAALAATDRLDVRLGEPPARERTAAAVPASGTVRVPEDAEGLALVAGGRLWLATRSGLGVQGLAARAAELSPNATFAAVGIGEALVAIAPGGRRAWSHPAGGPVVAAAWAPNPIAIAYVVRRGPRHELRVIEGDGDGDRLVDADVAPVRPSWRADTQALAYVARGGQARAADYPSLATRAVADPPAGVAAVAYAPDGDRLALATAGPGFAVSLRGGPAPAGWMALGDPRSALTAFAWASSAELLAAGDDPRPGAPDRIWSLLGSPLAFGKPAGTAFGAAPAAALAPIGDGRRLAVAVAVGEEMQVWETAAPALGRDAELRPQRVLLRVPAGPGRVSLSVR